MTVTRSPIPKRRAAALALTGITCASAVLASPGVAAAEGVADAEKSIVLVGVEWEGYVEYPDTEGLLSWSPAVTAFSLCTGWFASEEGHIVTAGHCVDPAEGKSALLHQFLAENDALDLLGEAQSTWRVEGQDQGSDPERIVQVVQPESVEGAAITTPLTVQVADYQPAADGDLALLQANGLTDSTPALPIAEEPAEIGDEITAIGFPAAVATISDVSRLRASFKSGTVSSTQVSPNGVAGTEVNADISGGMSGGPTLDESGAVLGVNSYTITGESRNFNFITDARALRSYLQRLDVPVVAPVPAAEPSATSSPAKAGNDSAIPVWAYAAGGGGLLVILVLGLLLVRRRASSAPAAGPAPLPAPVPSGPAFPAPVAGPVAGPAAAGPVAGPFAPGPVSGPVSPGAGTAAGLIPVARASMESAPAPGAADAVGPCSHEGNAPGARFCQNCGGPLGHTSASGEVPSSTAP